MSAPPILVRPKTTLADTRLMQQRNIRRLPVVLDRRPASTITWGDLPAG